MNSVDARGRHPRSWSEFLAHLSETFRPNRHIKKLIKNQDYLTACEVLRRTIGRDDFIRAVRDEFQTPSYAPARIHESLFALDSRIVATPNFDKIYETYANGQANGSIVIKHHYDDDINLAIRSAGRVILKIHGTIDSPDRLIFTRAEYASARTRYSSFYENLHALVLTHTFVFLGCGVNDPDIRLLLEDTFFRHPSGRAHLMLLPTNALHTSIVKVVEDTMNLRIVRYSPQNDHEELRLGIAMLRDLVEEGREKLRDTRNW